MLKAWIIRSLTIMFILVCLVSALAYGAYGHHYLELISHFRVQYLYLQLFCMTGLLLLRQWRIIAFSVIGLALNLIPVLPYYQPHPNTNLAHAHHLRVLQINLLGPNQNHAKVLQYIHSINPDIIGAEEVRPHWSQALTDSLTEYPYRVIEPEDTAFGIALFSKYPLRQTQVVKFGQPFGPRKRYFASIVTNVQYDRPFTVIVTHPLPPMRGFSVRNSQLADIARHRPAYQENLMLIGDLNVTPWSPYFQDLLKNSGLRDSQLGFGVQSSWQSPIPGVMIPIDHVLVSPRFSVLARELGPDIGSDHRPVLVDLSLLN